MSRKHFEAIAAEINRTYTCAKELRDVAGQSEHSREVSAARCFGIKYAAEAVANACAESNPRFNRAHFLQACGITE